MTGVQTCALPIFGKAQAEKLTNAVNIMTQAKVSDELNQAISAAQVGPHAPATRAPATTAAMSPKVIHITWSRRMMGHEAKPRASRDGGRVRAPRRLDRRGAAERRLAPRGATEVADKVPP